MCLFDKAVGDVGKQKNWIASERGDFHPIYRSIGVGIGIPTAIDFLFLNTVQLFPHDRCPPVNSFQGVCMLDVGGLPPEMVSGMRMWSCPFGLFPSIVFAGELCRGNRFDKAVRKHGWRIHVAAGPRQATALCSEVAPDLVIIDDFPECLLPKRKGV
jgi:hypothetical protein